LDAIVDVLLICPPNHAFKKNEFLIGSRRILSPDFRKIERKQFSLYPKIKNHGLRKVRFPKTVLTNNLNPDLLNTVHNKITKMEINKAIKNRWSPRAFSDIPVTDEMINLLFEAARWAPSSRNEQPWNYYFVQRENQKVFDDFVDILIGNNPDWAKEAQVLIISVLKKNLDYKNRPNGKALHDIGAANASIAIQASEMGLQVHQMGGFDKEKATEYLKLDIENFEPVTAIAVGFPGDPEQLSEELKLRELIPRTRKELEEFVFEMK